MYEIINNSKVMYGISSILISLGSKYVFGDITPEHQAIFSHPIVKNFIIFLLIFSTTRDVVLSACLSALIATLLLTVFNKNSIYHHTITRWGPSKIINKVQMHTDRPWTQAATQEHPHAATQEHSLAFPTKYSIRDIQCANEFLYV